MTSLTPFSEIQALVSDLEQLQRTATSIKDAAFIRVYTAEKDKDADEDDEIFYEGVELMTISAHELRDALLTVIESKVKAVTSKLTALGVIAD